MVILRSQLNYGVSQSHQVTMRPTIPLADYLIAVDLDATRDLGRLDAGDAVGCDCVWCENWRGALSATVPAPVLTQLQRIGVDPRAPSDLYAYDTKDEGHLVRVVYYVVGAVQSGPPATIDFVLPDGSLEVGRRYEAIRETTSWIGLTIAPPLGGRPPWAPAHVGPVLEVDFRLYVPWTSGTKAPPTHWSPPSARTRSRGAG